MRIGNLLQQNTINGKKDTKMDIQDEFYLRIEQDKGHDNKKLTNDLIDF